MNGIHDMGGLHGFGPVLVEVDEPVFHARWEGRVYAMTQVLDTTGIYNLDEHRHEIELMDPAQYLQDGYYGRWLFAMESILDRKDILKRAEIDKRTAEMTADATTLTPPEGARNWPLSPENTIRWGALRPEVEIAPLYAEGQRLRVRNIHPEGHTRVTNYTRGKVGTVTRVNAQPWILPDTRAHNAGDNPQAVYTLAFDARTLWGEAAEPGVVIHIDFSEFHLEPEDTPR